jgi:preprotein translocase subunit YajC
LLIFQKRLDIPQEIIYNVEVNTLEVILMNFNTVVLNGGLGGSVGTIVMIVVMIAFFYFFLYRPQKKQEKEAQAMKNALEVGDEITTIGGIIGEIVSIKDETCVIETSKEKTKIRILKSSIAKVDVHANEK